MNIDLLTNILDFNLDGPLSEYGFTTRLENENFWTVNFARDAILEYKRYMYLAAVSDAMVSPSAIVDVVWHQHLIFSKSYDDFCSILGKKIVHIPSTHQAGDFDKFNSAKEHTKRLYNEKFGPQDPRFWEYDDMYGPLQLEGSRYSLQHVISIGLMCLLLLIAAGYVLLLPIYVNIENPYFLYGYFTLILASIAGLHFYNRAKLSQIIDSWDKSAFVFNLTALELVYLNKNQINAVINGVVNRLILDKKVVIVSGRQLDVKESAVAENVLELCVLQTIASNPNSTYKALQSRMALKPAFSKTARAMDAFNGYFTQAAPFIKLFMLNFAAFSVLFVFGSVRLITGFSRGKPIEFLVFVMIFLSIAMVSYLKYLTVVVGVTALPKYYKNSILPERPEGNNWEWEYFLMGTAVYDYSFKDIAGSSSDNAGSGGDSGGSSCGSGGGCGGCGSS